MSAKSNYTATILPAFTLTQFAAITKWSSSRPFGLRARINTHYPDFPETVEVYRRYPSGILYLMNRTSRRTVRLSRLAGETWKVRSVEKALAIVLTQEQQGAAAPHADPGRLAFTPSGSDKGWPATHPADESLEPNQWQEKLSSGSWRPDARREPVRLAELHEAHTAMRPARDHGHGNDGTGRPRAERPVE